MSENVENVDTGSREWLAVLRRLTITIPAVDGGHPRQVVRVPATETEAGDLLQDARMALVATGALHGDAFDTLCRLVDTWPEAVRPSGSEIEATAAMVGSATVRALEARIAQEAPRAVEAPAAQGEGPDLAPELVQPPADQPKRKRKAKTDHQALMDHAAAFLATRSMPDAMSGFRDARWNLIRDDLPVIARAWWTDRCIAGGEESLGFLTDVLEEVVHRLRERRRSDLESALIGKPGTDAGRQQLAAWVAAIWDETYTGKTERDNVLALHTTVMLHWCWLVKRQAAGLPTEHDLMPVIVGPQGSGKTTGVERLTDILKELAVKVDCTILTDERKVPSLGRLIIGRWEEMQGSTRADLEALKSTLTSGHLTYRPMQTNELVTIRKTATFIGTSNIPVARMVQDVTGARRFWEIQSPAACDWEAINAVDYALLWQCISETDPAPIKPVLHLMRAEQARLVHRDAVNQWIDYLSDNGIAAASIDRPDRQQRPDQYGNYHHATGMPFEEVCARFGYWCRTVGQPLSIGTKTLAQRLEQEGWIHRRVQVQTGSTRTINRWFVGQTLIDAWGGQDGPK